MNHSELIIEVETAPIEPFEKLPKEQQHYLMERELPGRATETADERLNLSPLYGKIIAIGLWLLPDNKSCLLLDGKEDDWVSDLELADKCFSGSEKALLDTFWKIANKYSGRVITWNGRSFDIPFLYLRSAINDVPPTRNILGKRYSWGLHCDLFEVVTFFGASRIAGYSLEAHCHAFGIQTPKKHMTGKDVAEAYQEGIIEEIGEYCMGDVKAALHLYQKLKPTIEVLGHG